MIMTPLETDALKHWKAIVVLWFIVNGVNAMPRPEGQGFAGSPWYKWIFSLLHSTFGMLPRMIATFVPQSAKVIDTALPPTQPDQGATK